jgi:hypothetical protein
MERAVSEKMVYGLKHSEGSLSFYEIYEAESDAQAIKYARSNFAAADYSDPARKVVVSRITDLCEIQKPIPAKHIKDASELSELNLQPIVLLYAQQEQLEDQERMAKIGLAVVEHFHPSSTNARNQATPELVVDRISRLEKELRYLQESDALRIGRHMFYIKDILMKAE